MSRRVIGPPIWPRPTKPMCYSLIVLERLTYGSQSPVIWSSVYGQLVGSASAAGCSP
jgi:hypothetical protein